MPAFEEAPSVGNPQLQDTTSAAAETTLPFPPVSRDHIIHCSYDQWFPKYRTSCIRSRVIPLPAEFISYIREDGIILADDDRPASVSAARDEEEWQTGLDTEQSNSTHDDDSASDAGPPQPPPNQRFPELHQTIKSVIQELGGSVVPKLNWSAPKDATWISPHQNTLKCTSPNDIYLLLKSSSFVSHDLEHAFDDCVPSSPASFTHVLILRPFFTLQPALEFRCFVKHRTLIALCQRDLNYYAFLRDLRPTIVSRVQSLFNTKLRHSFPDPSFVFDVYLPEDHDSEDGTGLGRVRLIDINPWAPRTDPILFDWGELLGMKVPEPLFGSVASEPDLREASSAGETTDDEERVVLAPDLRLVGRDDPVAHRFSTPRYSAHKLPKEVVDASLAGEGGLVEFARQWKEITEGRGGDMWEGPRAA